MEFVTTKVEGCLLSVEYVDGIVRIQNKTALNNLLKDLSHWTTPFSSLYVSLLSVNNRVGGSD
ncbi:hypothetical protein [Lysinibacillus sp. JNUCC 51]|uniref:hypothetical protein n=1 Tax=Lysinibacillus sp. JNUCC-51 TaxID=2792479 RepID=UPI001939063F|nr:hypothetical protein JNUCC51_11495 [Lysinibacillus sp. JNUCC-51]